MTSQQADTVELDGQGYNVTAIEGDGLFDPGGFGLRLRPIHTGCWRGFVCHYEVPDGLLFIKSLELGSDTEPPQLGGVRAHLRDHVWHFDGLRVETRFTGRMLVARKVAADRPYLHMGFWPAWMFDEVRDVAFDAGRVVDVQDRSAELAEVRARLGPAGTRPRDGQDTREWIAQTFSLTYDYSLGRSSRG